MNTLVEGYEQGTFPYYPILEELTDEIRVKGINPTDAYRVFDYRRYDLNPFVDYASTAVTSGGHARREDLSVPEIIEANTVTARRISGVLHRQGAVEGSNLVLPVDLGNTGWTQSEYMKFWLLVISGIDTTGNRTNPPSITQIADRIDEHMDRLEVDHDVMNSRELDRSAKERTFVRFAMAMAAALETYGDHLRPARRLIQLVDTNLSLGSFTEATFAEDMRIPRCRLVAVGPVESSTEVCDEPLKSDVKVLLANGAEVTIAAKRSTLTLQRNLEPVMSADALERVSVTGPSLV